jgi:hypothetical protein
MATAGGGAGAGITSCHGVNACGGSGPSQRRAQAMTNRRRFASVWLNISRSSASIAALFAVTSLSDQPAPAIFHAYDDDFLTYIAPRSARRNECRSEGLGAL